MTGQEARDYVVKKFLRTDKDTEIYDAMTDVIADMNIKFNAEDYREEAYVSGISTVGEYQIALPSDFGNIIGNVSITDTSSDEYYAPLKKISKTLYDEKYSDRLLSSVGNVHTAVPREFCIYANQIYVAPVPDKITYRYQINYTTENTSVITSATDPVPFTVKLKHRNVLRNGVLFELHDGMENFNESAYYKSLYLNGLEGIKTNEDRNRTSSDSVRFADF